MTEWRRGWDCSRPDGRSSLASLGTDRRTAVVSHPLAASCCADSRFGLATFACSWVSPNGGEGGIRTHVPVLPDHPISSRRRYDRFGTSPAPHGCRGAGILTESPRDQGRVRARIPHRRRRPAWLTRGLRQVCTRP